MTEGRQSMADIEIYTTKVCPYCVRAKNLLNAQRFIDMIISPEIQNVFSTTMTNRPVIAGVETPDYMTPFGDINVIQEDMEYVYVNKDKITDHFKEIYVSNQ